MTDDNDERDDDFGDDEFDGSFDDDLDDGVEAEASAFEMLDEREAAMVEQDLADLDEFEAAFGSEGYRGVAVWCHDCAEEHYYPWAMLRENLTLLLRTGEAPVHEPAFAPEPSRYVPWDYARGYVDALRDAGLADLDATGACPRCGLELGEGGKKANFCPRCGGPLLGARLADALAAAGLDEEAVHRILGSIGLPRPT